MGVISELIITETTMMRWETSCFGSLGPWQLPPAMLPLEPSVLEHVAKVPGLEDGAVLSLGPLQWSAPWKPVDSLVVFLPMNLEATLSG